MAKVVLHRDDLLPIDDNHKNYFAKNRNIVNRITWDERSVYSPVVYYQKRYLYIGEGGTDIPEFKTLEEALEYAKDGYEKLMEG